MAKERKPVMIIRLKGINTVSSEIGMNEILYEEVLYRISIKLPIPIAPSQIKERMARIRPVISFITGHRAFQIFLMAKKIPLMMTIGRLIALPRADLFCQRLFRLSWSCFPVLARFLKAARVGAWPCISSFWYVVLASGMIIHIRI